MLLKTNLRKKIKESQSVYNIMAPILSGEDEADQMKEHFWVIGTTAGMQVKYIELATLGLLDSSLVHPRETFRTAIVQGVSNIIICHNHPGGELIPSRNDDRVTAVIRESGELIGIHLTDHVIIARDDYYSYADKGRLHEVKRD